MGAFGLRYTTTQAESQSVRRRLHQISTKGDIDHREIATTVSVRIHYEHASPETGRIYLPSVAGWLAHCGKRRRSLE